MKKPVLVLQMQRLGDLILTFPLLALLQRQYPGHPIWTVAEPQFFSQLCHFSPHTVFFPPEAAPKLRTAQFHAVINLSHRKDAAHLAGSLDTPTRFGAYHDGDHTFIAGDWSLYRASIVDNNRYNLFHWSDIYQLDHTTHIPAIHANFPQATSSSIGIFVGASEAEKRPTPEFFANLAKALLQKQYKPIFLGGPDDVALGETAARLANIPKASMCGKLNLTQLANLMKELALCITPDTGPMHLAAWVNTPVLNLSFGPVNPWETGPLLPGHTVVQPACSCSGCWRACNAPMRCQKYLHAGRIALLVHTLVQHPQRVSHLQLSGLRLWRTGRDARGLYTLLPLGDNTSGRARLLLSRFWQEWFWQGMTQQSTAPLQALAEDLQQYPELLEKMRFGVVSLSKHVREHLKERFKGNAHILEQDFWQRLPRPIRPFTGFRHLFLQNNEYTSQAWDAVLQDLEKLGHVLQR